MSLSEIISSLFLLSGVVFIFIANFGILTLPDLFCRTHALSKAITLGILLMLIGFWIHLGSEAVGLKVFLILLFQFITIPISTHLFTYYATSQIYPDVLKTEQDSRSKLAHLKDI